MTADAGIHGHDPACDCKQCVTAQRDQLLAFTKEVMQAWPEGGIDGGELRLTNATTGGPPYTAPELRAHVRPGALDASALPSRVGKRLFYPDGRVGEV